MARTRGERATERADDRTGVGTSTAHFCASSGAACHRPTIARLLALRNISLGGEQEAKEEGEEEEEHANAMGKLLEFVCDIPGSCGEGLQALGLWEPSEEVQRLWDNIKLAAAADAKPVLDPADYPVT